MEKEFLKIVTENQGIIHKVCSIYCSNEEDRRDLFQEILTQLWKSYPSFNGKAKFTTWMYRVALNTAITRFKKNKRQPDRSGPAAESLQLKYEEYDNGTEEKIRQLHQAVNQLSGLEKSIILLFLENNNYEEIAKITGITQNYVRVKMNRIKNKLRKQMNQMQQEPEIRKEY